ncbi:hypothetical protein V6N11_002109 [Hibiscus sabdariffa]|uniref:Endonuclease/exonuclease/phosphatase domain-containing protein n=1 Tax=Hibiscus sabdariffa TaxID=183260 RepID=A0ABR2QUF2_9ROSI
MSIMSWNARGMRNKGIVRTLKDAAFKFRPGIIFLSETKKKKCYLKKIKMKIKVDYSFYVDPIGIAGGLALWWLHEVSMVILNSGKNFIDTKVSVCGEEDWFLTFIYGPPYANEKQVFWESLASLRSNRSEKWCVIGDSNMVTRPEEKIGGAPFDASSAKWFYDFMDTFCLLELPLKGGTFTWSNQRSEDEAILEKLDRILISLEWSISFPKAIGILDATIASDHALIFLILKGMSKRFRKDFKFEAKWVLEDGCTDNVQDGWHSVNDSNRIWSFEKKLSQTRKKTKAMEKVEKW